MTARRDATQAVPAMDWPTGWAFDPDDGGAPTPPAPSKAPAAPLGERKEQVATVAEAVAELERRAAERRAQRKAEKAEREDAVAAKRQKTAADVEQLRQEAEGEVDPEDDDDADEEGNTPDAKRKARKTADADGDDEDTEDDGKKKRRRASEDDSEDDDGDVSAADEDDADDSDEDDDGDDKKLKKSEKLKVGDTEVEIPKGTPKAAVEAIKSLQHRLTADYTRKTQEVAQGRQVLMQRAQQADSMVQQALQAQEVIVRMAQQMIGSPPPLELAQTDIQQYTIQKALYEQRIAQLQGLGGHTQQLRQAQAQAQAQQRDQMLAQEAQHMVRFMPALASPENRQRFMAEASAVAAKSGFSPQDVATVGDHRMLHLLGRLIEAEARLAAYGKAGASTKQRLANVPPKVRSSDSAAADQGKGQKAARAMQDFKRSKRSLQDVRRYINATQS